MEKIEAKTGGKAKKKEAPYVAQHLPTENNYLITE